MRLRYIIICVLPCCAVFFHIISYTVRFSGGGDWTKNACFNFLYNFFSETFLILRINQPDPIIHVYRSLCEVPVILVMLYWNLNFIGRLSKNTQMQHSWKSLHWESWCSMGTKKLTDIKMLFVTFRNFSKASEHWKLKHIK
jgi:hypothetical protein